MIRTERLLLRPWRDDDLEPFAQLNADPAVMEHFPALLDREQSDAMAARIRAYLEREDHGLWAVEVPGVAPFIGFCGLQRPAFMQESVEVGWRLAHAHWGKGYATEGARACVEYGFTTMGLDEIVAMVVPGNTRSQRVMEKLGMTRDPSADFDHPRIPEGSPVRAHWLFRLRK